MLIFSYCVLFLTYSIPPLRFKARPFLDSLSNAAYALPLLFLPAFLQSELPRTAFYAMASWSVAKHAFDAIQDSAVDKLARRRDNCYQAWRSRHLPMVSSLLVPCSLLYLSVSPLLAGFHFILALGLLLPLASKPTCSKLQFFIHIRLLPLRFRQCRRRAACPFGSFKNWF